jgi:hypothetical protein
VSIGCEFNLCRLSSGQIRNRASAEISVPDLLVRDNGVFKWRADLIASENYWSGWFLEMSNKFLQLRGAKLLVLAGNDRLDKLLMIGQMQGNFTFTRQISTGNHARFGALYTGRCSRKVGRFTSNILEEKSAFRHF